MGEEIKYPYIVFKLQGTHYCISSKYITTLVQLPDYTKVPAAPANIVGVFRHRDTVIQMIDLRTTLGMEPLSKEYEAFTHMIDDRKDDHVHWVNELEKSALSGTPFTLSRDPHQCALGRWYYNFKTDNNMVAFHLKKIEEPHARLHEAADELSRCQQSCNSCERTECLKDIMKRVKEENMPLILNLLDETKKIFGSNIYREMVLLIAGTKWGLVVDEVVGVQELSSIEQQENSILERQSMRYISDVKESGKKTDIIFELNMATLFEEMNPIENAEEMV